MDCKAARERLHDYLSRELGDAETAVVEGHLGACPDCRGAFERWQKFRAAVRRAGQQVEVPAGFGAMLSGRLRDSPPRPVGSGWLSGLRLAPLLAAVIVLLAGVPLVLRSLQPTPQGSPAARATAMPLTQVDGVLASMVADDVMHGNRLEPPDSQATQTRVMEQYRKVLGTPPRIPAALDDGHWRDRCFLCPVGGGHIPHVRYRLGARTVSLFLAPTRGVAIDGRQASNLAERSLYSARLEGENLLAWRSGATVYVLVSREPPEMLMDVAVELFRRG